MSVSTSETLSSGQDRSLEFPRVKFQRDKTYDNQTGEFQQSQGTTLENRTTGLWGHICYWDGDQRVSVTRVAVHMEEKGTGM